MRNLPHTRLQCAASSPYANNGAASWPWTARSVCSLGFLGPAPQDWTHCTAPQPYTAWPCRDPALHWLCVIDSIFALSLVPHLRPAVVPPLVSLQLSSVLCYSLGPHCCTGLADSPRIWAWLLAMHHCAVPTDGMPPQHCISASHGACALDCTGCVPAPGLALHTAPLPCNAAPHGIPSFLGLTTEGPAGGVSHVPVGSPS